MKGFPIRPFAPILDLLYPPRCLSCRRFLERGARASLCPDCEAAWPHLVPPFCSVCATPFHSAETSNHLCGDCLEGPRVCRRLTAAGLYKGVLHDLVIRMKYRGEERIGRYLGERMSSALEPNGHDLILPIPLSPDRLRGRGFNQAMILAAVIGRSLRTEVDPFLLIKTRETPPQVDLKGEERRKNLKGAFRLKDSEAVEGKNVLLVDDVYTTGTTIETAAKALLRAGAESVEAVVVARVG